MSGSLRDQLESAVAEVEETAQAPATSGAEAEAVTATPASEPAAAPEDKPGRTAGRARDEQGKLLPGKAVRPQDSAATPNAATPIRAPEQAGSVVAADPKPLARPSTLKKELWPVWDKLAKGEALTAQEARLKAEWILQRDSDYAKGVSTYKAEADNAKPVLEALTPFLPALQANGMKPEAWISQLGNAHQTLVYGDPQAKLAMFARMAQDYKVDLAQLFVKGQDGQIYLNQQLSQARPAAPQPQPDIRKSVKEILEEERAVAEVASMKADTEKYPHLEVVTQTMVGLLQSGLATTYAEAYEAALRHPRHSDLFEAQQQQQREQEEAKKREEAAKVTALAKRNAISPRTSTPTAAAAGTSGKKGLRDVLEEAVNSHASGRV